MGLSTVPFALVTTTNKWLLMAAFVGLRRDQIPHAGIITRITQQIGGSFGVAVLAVILDIALRHHMGSAAQSAHAFGQAFWWAAGFAALSLVPSLLLPGRSPTGTPKKPEPETTKPLQTV